MAKVGDKGGRVASDGTFGFDEWADLVDPARIGAEFAKRMPMAHERVGVMFKAEATKVITRDQPFEPNAPGTIAAKGSDVPLQDRGNLIGSLGHTIKSVDTVRLGVSSPRTKKGQLVYEILHEGATIRGDKLVAARRALFAKMRKRMGKTKFEALSKDLAKKPAKTEWVIPPRPFLQVVFDDPVWLDRSMDVYRDMLRSIFEER